MTRIVLVKLGHSQEVLNHGLVVSEMEITDTKYSLKQQN